MIRILALNEESQSGCSEDDGEPSVTKEAQETIAVSEFVRALKLKTNNALEDACTLFRELLETEVLHNVSNEKKDKLFLVKYNCYKNLGFIYIEKGDSEMALDHLLNAYELDDTDVFTMNKLGQLALKMNKLEIAQITFEKCLKQNPNHWPALDGVLKVLCLKENYSEAYGWALLCYSKDSKYEFALNTILEIRNKFQNMGLEYIENCFKIKFQEIDLKRTSTKSVFPGYVIHEELDNPQPDLSEFKVQDLTWSSIGQLIIDLYQTFEVNDWPKHTIMTLNDFLSKTSTDIVKRDVFETELQSGADAEALSDNIEITVPPTPIEVDSYDEKDNSNSNEGTKSTFDQQIILSADGSAEDSDATKQSDANNKPKQSRRRGSDLSFLEQWGWHKTKKRHVQRRKTAEQNDGETSISGILRRILFKYFESNFDEETIFPTENTDSSSDVFVDNSQTQQPNLDISLDDFQISTQSLFDEFVDEIKNHNFNIIMFVSKWMNYISRAWNQRIPQKLQEMYLKLYVFYLNHYDLCTWNLLDSKDFKAAFRMALFYLELYHNKLPTPDGKPEINPQWFSVYNHVIFQSGFYEVTNEDDKIVYAENRIRILWLQYCLGKYENDLQRAVDCLYSISQEMEEKCPDYKITFPNLKQNNKIDLTSCSELKKTLERTISLNSVNQLYHENNYDQLIAILKDSIVNFAGQKSVEYNSPIRLSTQIEVFLESLWNLELYEDCLIWSERCLKYALDNYIIAPSDTYRQTEWGDLVTYVLTYIEALINQESIEIVLCLEGYYSRLIQSLSKIVVNQLDVPFDKTNNRAHPVTTKIPWVILYHVLQREEDMLPVRPQSVINERDEEELEEAIPNSLMIFFTAHEFLGRHRQCTNHNGQFLLFILDVVATRLRAPYLEPFREIISEYLEQVTYCLYGYPSKKARARHIGKHDAVNIELDWNKGMQLFDIYRPDNLPEFNSYKNDSITTEHEQLLQRIIALIPSDVDPNTRCQEIRDFISGTAKEMPQPFRLLPHRVYCIYYLLADYYFKNRDMVRSVKYYILDLTTCPTRFDSWAGLALSKASTLEVKLNSCASFCTKEFISESEEALRCFRQCFELNKRHVLLWIEYGNFAYMMHSFYSRNLKLSSDTLSMERFEAMEKKKEECLKAAKSSFNTVEQFVHRMDSDDDQDHDEKWLYHYMLGKIAEKRKEQPSIFLDHYNKSAKCLFENNASYPFRINHSNPQNLSIEALEVYYRITSSVVKYLEQHAVVKKSVGKQFLKVLKEIKTSPFALNQAKINNSSINAFKRKLSLVTEEQAKKRQSVDASVPSEECQKPVSSEECQKPLSSETSPLDKPEECVESIAEPSEPPVQQDQLREEISAKSNDVPVVEQKLDSPTRRRSQESNVTTTTNGTTTTTTGSDSTSSSSSESTTSDSSSDSGSESSDGENDRPLSDSELETIYRICIRNLEECVTRFPEHYKSIYRLANIYLHATEKVKDLKRCKQLMIGTYTTALSNQIQGLFSDRKLNNFFSGIWRIPSSEIDRPGSFSAHMSRCTIQLMEVLLLSSDHNILLELALNLNRNPENDKRYIKEDERKELFQQAISFCIQSIRNQISLFKECPVKKRDEKNLLSLLIDIFKAHQKTIKHLIQKENIFGTLLIDGYKVYVEGKLERLPENTIVLDAAIKLCQCEIVIRKNHGKPGVDTIGESSFVNSLKMFPALANCTNSTVTITSVPSVVKSDYNTTITKVTTTTAASAAVTSLTTPATTSTNFSNMNQASYSRPRGRPPGSRNTQTTKSTEWNRNASMAAAVLGIYSNPSLPQYTSPAQVTALLDEYIKLSAGISSKSLLSTSDTANLSTSLPASFSPSSLKGFISTAVHKFPKFEKKNIISSSTAIAQNPTSTVISVGSGQLTITPSSYTAPKVSKISPNRLNETSLINYNDAANFDLESVIPKSELSATKIFNDMTGVSKVKSSMHPPIGSNMNIPKDLPKSLTITPTPTGYTGKPISSNPPHVTLQPEITKKNKSQKYTPYTKGPVPVSSPYGVMPGYPNYTQQLINMMSNMVPNPAHKSAQIAQSRNKTRTQASTKKDSKTMPYPMSASSMLSSSSSMLLDGQLSALASSSSRQYQPPTAHRSKQPTNVTQPSHAIDSSQHKFGTTPAVAFSPNKSPVLPPPVMSRQPSPAIHQISPQKTLQQKLAERQKSLQQDSKKQE